MPPTAESLLQTVYPTIFSSEPENDNDSEGRTQSLIGIAVAIGGNVLISLALNCQKLAHKRLELQKQNLVESSKDEQEAGPGIDSDDLSLPDADGNVDVDSETRPLTGSERRDPFETLYKTHTPSRSRPRLVIPRGALSPRRRSTLASSPIMPEGGDGSDVQAISIDVAGQEDLRDMHGKRTSIATIDEGDEEVVQDSEARYLKSKLWWFGFLLMNVGEFGNFLSYAYAPASVVAPLGTVALIANCFFAPLMLKEKLRKRDFVGVILSIFGAVTIVGAAKSSDVRLDPAGLVRAITRRPFIIYAIICVILIIIFGVLAAGPAGRKYVFIDVVLCALFGGFTVLATKAVSTLLSLHWIEIFKDRITYPVVAVLAVTGIGQVKYLNRALMKFDSKVVIPTFFVTFNLSAIVGSAILYGDFKDVQVHQITTFLYGCVTTFVGVFFLTRSTGETGVALEAEVVHPEGSAEDGDGGSGTPDGDVGPRPMLMPQSQSRGTPVLRTQASSASLVLSPGQYLLLAASPPRERAGSMERPRNNSGSLESPGSVSRRRGVAWEGTR